MSDDPSGPSETTADPPAPSGMEVNAVTVAVKHPGVFMETTELEQETGAKGLPKGKGDTLFEKPATNA